MCACIHIVSVWHVFLMENGCVLGALDRRLWKHARYLQLSKCSFVIFCDRIAFVIISIYVRQGRLMLCQFQENLVKKSVAGIDFKQTLLDESDHAANKATLSCLSRSSKRPKTISIIRSHDNKAPSNDLVCAGSGKNMHNQSDMIVHNGYLQLKSNLHGHWHPQNQFGCRSLCLLFKGWGWLTDGRSDCVFYSAMQDNWKRKYSTKTKNEEGRNMTVFFLLRKDLCCKFKGLHWQVRFANMLEEVVAKVEALAEAARHEGRRWTR